MPVYSGRRRAAALLVLGGICAVSSDPSPGQWETWHRNTGVTCIHNLLLPNDRLVCIERPQERPYGINLNTMGETAVEIDISQPDQPFQINPIHKNAFCGGHAQLADGTVLVVGGDARSLEADGIPFLYDGRKGVRLYRPCEADAVAAGTCKKGTWEDQPEMSTNRWYPTVTTLQDGSAIIVGGTMDHLDFGSLDHVDNPTYEYFPPKTGGTWPRQLDLLAWAFPHNLYPFVFQLAESNHVFVFASNRTVLIDPQTDAVDHRIPDLPLDADQAPMTYPHSATAVVLPMTIANNWTMTIQICGGSKLSDQGAASANCYQISPDDPNASWKRVADLATARLMPDSVLLPTGQVLYLNGVSRGVAGGNGGQVQYAQDPVFQPDLYDPTSDTHTLLPAAASVGRLYHASALLTQSGHVLTTGSEMQNYVDYVAGRTECWGVPLGMDPSDHAPTGEAVCTLPFGHTIERFTPPYLQGVDEATRAHVASLPESASYGQAFAVTASLPADRVQRVVALRYTSSTHGLNTDQRLVELVIRSRKDTQLEVVAPRDGRRAPPGRWHLFLLNASGVPGTARPIMFGDSTTGIKSTRQKSGSVSRQSAPTTTAWLTFSAVGIAGASMLAYLFL
ncbi:hypothetical protein CXG81DRAFT_11913 [Caulochytrium protostelioides]|uniref:Galactose oxidase n=1 Tax=Caulochytrium protostelioides TaxID=1555241 RepID=A0A4P9X887_9FUNG|nr:hypothetical protein CXG81DRAFT_11913 [Caulochytrium protostelioides]|eukprot:RKP01494.1 hypothetical protein CXG81DRAFT_11913 [Caulochytrium protostelioides]